MKIGIMSDTHKKLGRAKKAVDLLMDEGIEFLVHAGDIVRVELLDYIQSKNIRYVAVLGNNDFHLYSVVDKYELVSEPFYFKLAGLTWKLMHYPRYMFPMDTDIIVYGHTHDVDITYNGKNLILNPGEVCARDHEFSTCMSLDITDEKYVVTLFYRKVKTKVWNKKIKEFSRGANGGD
ncbi:MAG: YfcE family phosphodiesterase [Epsilonproteobacteria bacterium]|nr:YfcE family phosphodiesterase [Campylobacterota bacterium]